MKRSLEVPRLGRPVEISPEMRDFLKRRTLPFLDSVGVDRPLSFLLAEIYLQGMKDAVEVLGK